MNLRGSTAIITGGAMGIGLATAKRLLREGCTVTLWDLNETALRKAAEELKPLGTVLTHVCDVTNADRITELAATAEREMGRVDILVNNAGYVSGGDFLTQPVTNWVKTMEVNVNAIFYTTYALLPGMYNRDRGHIVNISSAAGTIGVPGLSAYAASKWAVWGLTESLRLEAWNRGKHGVRYSSIHPSYIAQGMFAGAKLGFPGRLIVPLLPDHDVVARAIVESALKKGRFSPKRPRTVNLNLRLRAVMPDSWFQKFLVFMGVPESMNSWYGRSEPKK